jgi:serine protease Do
MWLGMSLLPVTREVALAHHLAQPSGLLVTTVDARSPARISGLQSGDILLALDAQRIKDAQELQVKIGEMTHQRTATLAIFRDGEIHQIEVNIGEAPGRVAQTAAVAVRP